MIKNLNKPNRLYLYLFGILFIFFFLNFTQLSDGFFYGYQSDSDGITRKTLICQKIHGSDFLGGSPVRRTSQDSTRNFLESKDCDTDLVRPYVSQYGIQTKVPSFFFSRLNMDIDIFLILLKVVNVALACFIFILFVAFVINEFSLVAGLVVFLLLLCSQWILLFARSSYWVFYTLFAPFIFTLIFYPKIKNSRCPNLYFYGLLFALFSFKFLAGYEYITTIMLSVLCAVIYHEAKLVKNFNYKFLKTIALKGLLVGLVGVLGLVTALAVHFQQLNSYYMDFDTTKDAIMARVMDRTTLQNERFYYHALGNIKRSSPEFYSHISSIVPIEDLKKTSLTDPSAVKNKTILLTALTYLTLPILTLPFGTSSLLGGILGSFIVVTAASIFLIMRKIANSTGKSKQKLKALMLAMAVSYVAPLSWFILASGHSIVHLHINGILLYLPTALFSYIILGVCLSDFIRLKR